MNKKISFSITITIFTLAFVTKAVWQAQAAIPSQEIYPIEQLQRHDQIYNVRSFGSDIIGAYSDSEKSESESPTISVPNSRIVFQSFRDMNWEIYIANGDGDQHTRLTINEKSDIHPRLNQGCTKIVFASNRVNNNYDIYTMNIDGSDISQLTNNRNFDDVYPSWSPDGTHIVYQSYQDGQPEIYVMNSDGTGQTRLTVNGGYDGMPVWSPDGTKISFTSSRSGLYLIHVMNIDGSNVVQLSAEQYSSDSTWSPDGLQIAYDADGNHDGWQELWVVNLDGSGRQKLYEFNGWTDTWARSWSPDGRYITFTGISFTYQGGWYWTEAYLLAYDMETGQTQMINPSPTEWNPDWKSTDASAPSSNIQALPIQSSSPIKVRWSGNDVGPSGLKGYFIQVKDGITGTWTNWLANTSQTWGYYPGKGGHTYYFRVKAIDFGGNHESWPTNYDTVTTVESYPPQAWFSSSDPSYPNQAIIEWDGEDIGNSGIYSYDVQYRKNTGGEWIDWQVGTSKQLAYFNGELGSSYQFRIRATDRAQNISAWVMGSNSWETTLCQWALNGKITDNVGVPVADAVIITSPQATQNTYSEIDGSYSACINEQTLKLTTQWNKQGYGPLPETDRNQPIIKLNVAMPPSDNIFPNGGFETYQDVANPKIVSSNFINHTGQNSLRLTAKEENRNGDPTHLYNSTSYSLQPVLALDSKGLAHLAWDDYATIYYASVSQDGIWSSPKIISDPGNNPNSVKLAIDGLDSIHVFWKDDNSLFTIHQNSNGQWSERKLLVNNPKIAYDYHVMTDSMGNVHIIWYLVGDGGIVFHAWFTTEGNWSIPMMVNQPDENASVNHPQINVDPFGLIHIAWEGYIYQVSGSIEGIFYTVSPDFGLTWTSPDILKYDNSSMQGYSFTVDQYGNPMIAWSQSTKGIWYSKKKDDAWSTPVNIIYDSRAGYESDIQIYSFGDGQAFVIGTTYMDRFFTYQTKDGLWQTQSLTDLFYSQAAIDRDDVYLFSGWGEITLRRFLADGSWSPEETLPITEGVYGASIAVRNGVIYLTHWWCEHSSSHYISYWDFPLADQDETVEYSKTLTIPNSMNAPSLSFYYRLAEWYDNDSNNFKVSINDGKNVTNLLTTSKQTNDWEHGWYDLSSWSGQTITITFTSHQTNNQPYLWAYIDDISVGSTHPDLWITTNALKPSALPEDEVVYEIVYGNRGAAIAITNTITITLPIELSFVSSDLPADVNGNTLTWSLDNLKAFSGPQKIHVITTVKTTAELGDFIYLPVYINTISDELEVKNNSVTTALYIGHQVYLPTITQ